MGQRIVIGAGPDGVRAAAVLATAGHRVTLLQEAATPTGLRHPELPQSSGRMSTHDDVRELTERVLGPLVEAPGMGRGLLRGGRVAWLPMKRRDVASLLPPTRVLPAAKAWLDARQRVARTDLTLGGQEERTYRDWVVRRMGEPAYLALYKPWASRRFGMDADQLGVAVARVHHAWPDPGPPQVAGGRYDVALDLALEVITRAGGTVRAGLQVEGLELQGGKVAAVRLQGGERLPVEGPLWVARPPGRVIDWMPAEVAAPHHHDAAAVRAADLLVVCLKGEVDGLPEELFVLDEDAPFWAVTSPYGIKEYALFMHTLPAGAPEPDAAQLATRTAEAAKRLGVGSFSDQDARVERVTDHQPVWTVGGHAHMHRIVNLAQDLGVVLVGRSGSWSDIDPGQELRLAAAYRDQDAPDQRQVLRDLVDPPVRLDDLRASIRRFLER